METAPSRFPFVGSGAGEIEIFIAAIRRLSRSRSVEEVMAVAAPSARKLLSADGITFVLREGDICHYADEDAISPLWKGRRFPIEACISGWCMINRQAATIPDVYKDERIPHDAYRPTFVRSLAMVPVNRDEPVGAMGAYWRSERGVTVEELDLLQTMADAASLAISNANQRHKEDVAERIRQDHAHRIKNIFTIAVALVNQTQGATAEDYRNALSGRFHALERAHSVMFEVGDGAVDFADMLGQLLSAYATDDRFQLQCETEAVPLSASEASGLALIINELASNATKYGALSVPEGAVTVSCQIEATGLRLTWRESDGPRVEPPSREGLGSKLIRAIAVHELEGKAELRYFPSGLECDLVLPLSKG